MEKTLQFAFLALLAKNFKTLFVFFWTNYGEFAEFEGVTNRTLPTKFQTKSQNLAGFSKLLLKKRSKSVRRIELLLV